MPWSIVRCLNIAALTFIQKKLRTVTFETFDSINSAIDQELRDRRVEGRANATSSALRGSVLVNPSIQKVRTKYIKKHPGKHHEFWTDFVSPNSSFIWVYERVLLMWHD